MLFIQRIAINYYKDVRYPKYAVEREKINFLPINPIPEKFAYTKPEKEHMLDCEVLLQSVGFWQYTDRMRNFGQHFIQYGEEIFTEGYHNWQKNNSEYIIPNLRIFKEENTYRIRFCDEYHPLIRSRREGHNESFNQKESPFYRTNRLNETAFRLKRNSYGRIIYNNRYTDYDTGKHIYTRTVYNIINCRKNDFREKMFFKKVPDFEYKSLKNLY